MPDAFSANLNLTKPEIGASADSWGNKLNGDMDLLDAVFLATGLGTSVGLHVGTGKILNVEGQVQIADSTDTTKRAVFDSSLITTATTRTFKFPDVDGTILISTAGGDSAEAILASATVSLSTSYVAKLTLPSLGAAGQKWVVSAYVTGRNPNEPDFIYAQIYNGTAPIAATNAVTAFANWTSNLTLSRIVTLVGPTVFSLRGKADLATSQFLGGPATGNNFTAINAVRLA